MWAAVVDGGPEDGRRVALKTILPHRHGDERATELFLEETRLAARWVHPHAVQVLEHGRAGETLFLAMEWISGAALNAILRSATRIDARLAVKIIEAACLGLHALHEQRGDNGEPLDTVHRDISPHNIMISSDGIVKVMDLGIAKANGRAMDTTTTGVLRGKVAYMAPEQAGGADLDRRADVFALGSILYEMTVGVRPFHADQPLQVLLRVSACKFVPPSACDPAYPADLEAIVLRAMAARPEDRYPTALDFARALTDWLSTRPTTSAADLADLVETYAGTQLRATNAMLTRVERALESGQFAATDTFASVPGGSAGEKTTSYDGGTTVSRPSSHRPASQRRTRFVAVAAVGAALTLLFVAWRIHEATRGPVYAMRAPVPVAAKLSTPTPSPSARTEALSPPPTAIPSASGPARPARARTDATGKPAAPGNPYADTRPPVHNPYR